MAENAENHSFSYFVLGKAVANTRKALSSLPRDIGIGGISLLVGFCIYWAAKGVPDAVDQVASAVAFTFAPLGVILAGVFLWHLLLAPAELAYDEMSRANSKLMAAVHAKTARNDEIDWSAYRTREEYGLEEFSKILARVNPAANKNDDNANGFYRLLREATDRNKIRHSDRDNRLGYTNTSLEREDAIRWAEENGYNVDHVK